MSDRGLRWSGQAVAEAPDAALLPRSAVPGLLRTVRTPELAGMTFHEVSAKSVLNAVPAASSMPFRWTVNPYRGCSHACVCCYARGSHAWLELDTGRGSDTEVVVTVDVAERLAAELARPTWRREHVALGTTPTRTSGPRAATGWCRAPSRRCAGRAPRSRC